VTSKAVNRVFRVTVLEGRKPKTFSMVVPASTTKKAAKLSVIARFGAHRVVSVK